MKKKHILPMERWKFIFYACLAYVLSPVILISSWARQKSSGLNSDSPKVLAVPIMTRVGDLVCSTVALRALKLHYPNSHLSVLVSKKIIDLLKTSSRQDRIININDTPFKGFWGRGRFFLFLFRERFDCVVCLSNNPFNNLVAWYSAAPYRIKTVVKHKSLAEKMTDILTNRHLLFETGSFLQDHYVALLRFLNVPFSLPTQEILPTKEGDEKALKYLNKRGLDSRHPLVGITPSAGHRAKEWPPERFAEVASALIKKYDARILLIDSPSNLERIKAVISSAGEKNKPYIFPAAEFTLGELPSLIGRLSALIAVDTGNIYIAHALGVPVVDITGPVHPDEQPPNDFESIQVRPPKEMEPVFFVLEGPTQDAYKKAPRIMASITSEMVIKAYGELVDRGVVR